MLGDLSRAFSGWSVVLTRRPRQPGVAAALLCTALLAGVARATDDRPAAETAVPAPVLGELAGMRERTGCVGAAVDERAQEIMHQGRPSLEVKGRDRGGEVEGAARDIAIFDPAAGRVVSYTCLAGASTRSAGEAIVSLPAVSNRADRLVATLLPGADLVLESVQRYQEGRTESLYYEARYTAASGDFPFFEPPVRLLLNATTGGFFRLDIDPDWFSPPEPPRVRISQKAAGRIATVVLRGRDLAAAFGPGAALGKIAGAELFTVHPNGNLGSVPGGPEPRARVAWVVPFRVDGGDAPGLHYLFVDAAAGRILGESSGLSTRHLAR